MTMTMTTPMTMMVMVMTVVMVLPCAGRSLASALVYMRGSEPRLLLLAGRSLATDVTLFGYIFIVV